MKKLSRKQTSNRKTANGVAQTITKKRRGGKGTKHRKAGSDTYMVKGYAGNKCVQMLGRTTYREELLMNSETAHRKREQLFKIGKILINPKVKHDDWEAAGRWSAKIPTGTEFSVLGLLTAMVSGKMKPLYTIDGKCLASG